MYVIEVVSNNILFNKIYTKNIIIRNVVLILVINIIIEVIFFLNRSFLLYLIIFISILSQSKLIQKNVCGLAVLCV